MSLRIIRHTYRGREGFLIVGRRAPGHFLTRIFTETRTSAEHIKAKVKRGEQVETKDFQC